MMENMKRKNKRKVKDKDWKRLITENLRETRIQKDNIYILSDINKNLHDSLEWGREGGGWLQYRWGSDIASEIKSAVPWRDEDKRKWVNVCEIIKYK